MVFKLIVLEGLDCSGKSTVSKLLQQRLGNAERIAFPDRTTEIGKTIDKYLKKETSFGPIEINLLYSANRYERSDYIINTLKHAHVICDRYFLSGVVYSAAKGLDYTWCRSVDEKLPQPDFTFFIDVDPTVTSKRGTFGTEAHDKFEFQQRVYEIYKQKSTEEKLIEINGNQTVEQIVDEIIQYLEKHQIN